MSKLREAVVAHPLFTKTRLYSLYSDFKKLKEVNPEGYEANIIAWKSLIEQLFQSPEGSLTNNAFVLDTDGLVEKLTLPEYGKPLALGFVLEELIRSGDLIPYKSFISENESIYKTKWVKSALIWAVNKFIFDTSYKIEAKNNNLKSDQLIHKKTLELITEDLMKIVQKANSNSTFVFTHEQLKSYLNSVDLTLNGNVIQLTDLDYEILIKYLHRDVAKIKMDEDYVKFGDTELTEEDRGIAHIKATIEMIDKKNDELTNKIESVSQKLKQSLMSNNKELSKNLLKSRKIAESSLNKQITSLNQLESVLYKIGESTTNLQLISALEKGSTLLKSLQSQIGGVERVEHLMDELEEENAKQEEITAELSRLGSSIDNDEIEEEFDRMLKQETEKKEIKKDGLDKVAEDLAAKLNELNLTPTAIKDETPRENENKVAPVPVPATD